MIFRPKWQHRNAQVRVVALQQLAASDPVLLQVAREDSDPSVRQQAVRRIGNLQSLFQLLADERDAAVREVCSKRLKRLLAGEEESESLAQRLQFLGECAEEEITAYVLQHAVEAELRQAALARVNRPALLAEVVLNDPSAELRLAALERIDRRATLERVAREARGKDKQVARRAKERLEAARTEELRPQRQAEICEAVEALVQQGGGDLVSFRRLEEEWHSLLPAADPEVDGRFAVACAAFAEAHARVQAEAALAARQRELCERIEQLLREVEGVEADLNGLGSAITLLQRAWESLEEELPNLNSGLKERFNDALSQLQRRRAERLRQREELACLQRLLARLGKLVVEDAELSAELLAQIDREWQAAGGGHKQAHTAALCERFTPLMRRAQQRLTERDRAVQALQQEYGMVLGQMEAALGEGQLRQATACRDKLADREKRLAGLGCRPSVQQLRRRKVANARLRELRDWRRYGTDNARDELLAQLAELQATPLAPLKQAEAVKALRAAWRELDRRDGIADDTLWQAFEQAAEAAYVPVREFHQEQAREREENLALRRRFIADLEQAYAAVDWQQPDWAALEQRLQQAQKQWPKLGGVERSAWEEVNARFRQRLAAFEQHLSARRESEKQRREALIRQVEAQADEPDLHQALAVTREAQVGWRPEVTCPQRVEQALWRRFKAACDAVYARQKARADAKCREEQEQLAYWQKLCEQAEALAAEAQEYPEPLPSRMAELQQQWRDSAGQAARRPKALQQRFDAVLATCRQAVEVARRRQAEAGRQRLLGKAALCDALEGLLFAAAQPAEAERLASAWQGLTALADTRLEQALSARFEQALTQLRSGTERDDLIAAAQENLDKRQALCLQMEILAGLDSPAAFAEARLAMQVQRLAGAMTGQMSEAERQAQTQQLLEEYCSIGPIPPEEASALQSRVEAVLASAG